MKIAIMQPYIFPYIGYFQLISAVDCFVIFDDVNFINKGWVNRNNLLVNGSTKLFTIPLRDAGQNKKINLVEIEFSTSWEQKLLKTITFNYKKSFNYEPVFELIESVINKKSVLISELNLLGLLTISNYLGIETKIIESSSIYNNAELKAQDRIIDICKKENATTYINPIGGVDLYTPEYFNKNGIELKFIKPIATAYKQKSNNFIPWLSIIDVLMNNPKEDVVKMLKNFEWYEKPI